MRTGALYICLRSGPIGMLVPETGRLSVLSAKGKIDGDGPAFSNEPHWAPDRSFVLFSFETGAAEVDAKAEKLRVLTSLMDGPGDAWSHAVGWLGSKCVAYIAGKDQNDAGRKWHVGLFRFTVHGQSFDSYLIAFQTTA